MKKYEDSLLSQQKEYQFSKLRTQDINKASTLAKTQAVNSINTEKDVNSISFKYPHWEPNCKRKDKEKEAKMSI